MASITVSFDAGTSGSKVIASYPSGECVFNDENSFLVEPSVRKLTKETYENLLENVEGGIGLNSSLVSYVDPSSQKEAYWQVGEAASRPGELFVIERKFETIVVKVLAFLGYLVSLSVKKEKGKISLNLGILLPLDEIGDRKPLANRLREIIEKGFEVNGNEIKNLSIEKMKCNPEGYGMYKSNPTSATGILIVGHSDVSWLFFDKGSFVVEESRTFPGAGMHSFIKAIDFPTQYELRTAEIIARAGEGLNPEILAELTQTKNSDEIAYLIQAIKAARPQYWSDRDREFGALNIQLASAISAGGGAANYFAKELNKLFKERFGVKLNWGKNLKKEFVEHFGLKSADKSRAALFLDCYGYYKSLPKAQIKLVPSAIKEERRELEVAKIASS